MDTEKKRKLLFLLKSELEKKTNLEKRMERNVFSRLLAKWNQNTFQSLSLKGLRQEEEGEQEADGLQQSTDALFRDRQDSLGVQVSAALLTWATYFQVSVVPKRQQLNMWMRRERERGRGSSAKLAPDKSCG